MRRWAVRPRQGGQLRYELSVPAGGEPATGGLPDEQPGALPEILPSPEFGKNIDRCWTCRAMFIQAWGHYGSVWPVVHQHLGVRPDLGRGRLELVAQLPSDAPIAGERIRLGDGALRLHGVPDDTDPESDPAPGTARPGVPDAGLVTACDHAGGRMFDVKGDPTRLASRDSVAA